jgi:phospholipid transport system substrate-binding protein
MDMRLRHLLLSLLVLPVVLSAPALAASPAARGPMATLRSYNERMDKLLRKKDGPVDKEAVRSLASELFDYRELARRAMAQHWDKLKPPQQEEFVKTFSQMIEKNYVKQLRSNIDYEVAYKDENITDSDAVVATIVKVRTKGKSTDVSIDYKLHKNGADWRVYDLVTDEVSMVRNYRNQFNKIITTESYDALLQKMRKRIAEADSDK